MPMPSTTSNNTSSFPLDPFYADRAARSPLPRADFAFFIHLHHAATILLDDWLARVAVMEKTNHVFDLFCESVTCLERLVSIEKTIAFAPERITADGLADLKLLIWNLEILTGQELPLSPAPPASSDTNGVPETLPASSQNKCELGRPRPLSPGTSVSDFPIASITPGSELDAAQSIAAPAITGASPQMHPSPVPSGTPLTTSPRAASSSPATPTVAKPTVRNVRACPILRAPGRALLKVFVTLARLTGRPSFELFKPELPRAPIAPQAPGASNIPAPAPSTTTSRTAFSYSSPPTTYPSLGDILAFFSSAFHLSPYSHAFSSG